MNVIRGWQVIIVKLLKIECRKTKTKKYKTEAQENLNFRKESKSEDKLTETSASPDYFPNSIKQPPGPDHSVAFKVTKLSSHSVSLPHVVWTNFYKQIVRKTYDM